ncbi:MAG: beta-CASP ribonuclease aCPSF1 [Nanoarchaeota archaeon]|nr:beta-CASP ribonuclease aCPSF1 [Nanoarchaeota archaeon]
MDEEKYPILKKVSELLPKNAMIVDTLFEGANIVLYSKNKSFVLDCGAVIKKVVNTIKKRVEVRADQSILLPVEQAESKIRKLIPAEAFIDEVLFDEKRSIVVIESVKPGVVIGKGGGIVQEIQKQTLWSPMIRRSPSIKSDLVKTIRYNLFKHSDYRRKFLHDIGKKIYAGFHKNKNYWIRFSALGGAREVGRSCFLVFTPESKVLVDCGINVASDENAFPFLNAPEVDFKSIDAVVISHSHVDHCGLIPFLFKYGYRGPVYCTEATRDVSTLLQIDSINVSQREGKNNLYSITDIKEMLKHVITLDYGVVTDITADVRLTLFNAGHVLGSSMVHMNIGEGFHNLLYTGDFKTNGTKLLPPAHKSFQRVETLVMESTYAKQEPPSVDQAEKSIIDLVNGTLENGGKVILPVLGVGRAQELIIVLEEALRKKVIPDVPIFVDGMVWDVNAIHTTYPEFFNRKVSSQIFNDNNNPFLSKSLKHVGSQKERKKIVEELGSCIILATSGMLVGGPSVFYLESLADDVRNTLIFTCYQGPGSLGRKIEEGSKEILKKIGKRVQTIPIKLRVEAIRGFSGHSSRSELISYVGSLNPKPRRIVVVHGEKSSVLDLASTLHQKFYVETSALRNLDTLRLR